MAPRGKPSPEECAAAFSRIVDLLDGTFVHGDGAYAEEASDIAAGFLHDLTSDNLILREKLTDPKEGTDATA